MAEAAVQGGKVPRGGPLVSDLLDQYMAGRGFEWGGAAGGYGRGSPQGWALWPVKRALGSRRVLELSPEVLGDYRVARMKDVAGSTVRREMAALGAAVKWGQKAGKVPWDFRFVLDLPPPGAPRTRYLSEAEEEKVWNAAVSLFMGPDSMDLQTGRRKPFEQRRVGLFVCLGLETAARKEALQGLTWDRVGSGPGALIDFRDPGRAVVGNKRRVPVPVSDRLKPVLDRARMDVLLGIGGGPKWVLGHDGDVRGVFERFRERVGVDFNVHDMRRTWASLRVSWGVPLEQVAGVLGDGLEVVQKHYAHLSPGFLVSAVNMRPPKVGAALGVVAA